MQKLDPSLLMLIEKASMFIGGVLLLVLQATLLKTETGLNAIGIYMIGAASGYQFGQNRVIGLNARPPMAPPHTDPAPTKTN